MSNLLTRALTGLLFVSLIVFSIIYSEWSTLIVFSLFFLLGTHEYFSLFKKNITIEVRWFLPTLFSSLIFYLLVFGIYFKSEFKLVLCIISPLVMLIMLSELWRKKTNPLVNMGVHLLGFVYLIVPFYTLIVIRVEEQNSVCFFTIDKITLSQIL
jgi:phosphatidate cytidylyltransferase